jgi:hypothetical protein
MLVKHLTEEQKAKLARLHYGPTRYEIEMVTPSGVKHLIAYTPRRSFRGLLDAVQERGAIILRVTGMPEDTRAERGDNASLRFSDGTIIRFSGRTQRDAIMHGELPYVGSLKA